MFAATRRWFRRNRTPIAIGVGVVSAGYLVTNYVLGKLRDARERMSSDRIAKENLRRRFEQNQEDCTFTVLALLPTATANILEALNTEKITLEIQQVKGSAVARTRSIGSTSPPSMSETNATDDDGRSIITVSAQSEAGIHTTQLSVATPPSGDGTNADSQSESMLVPSKPRKTKRQLWDDLTISSITRAYTLLYTLSLLTMLTRIQLNLLGRRSYLSSVVSLAAGGAPGTISLENNDDDGVEHAYGTDFEVNRKYLTFSWWLLNRGWVDVMHRVEGAVRQVFGHLSPRDTIAPHTFAGLTRDVRRLVEGTGPLSDAATGPTAWLSFLLPPSNMEEYVLRESGVLESPPTAPTGPEGGQQRQSFSPSTSSSPSSPSSAASLRRLLDETADLIDSPTFTHVHTQLLDAGFATLLEQRLVADVLDNSNAKPSGAPSSSAAATSILDPDPLDPLGGALGGALGAASRRAVALPKILSVLTRQAHAIGHGVPNAYLQAMEAVPDLEGFAAVVYSSNWQAEIDGGEGGDGVQEGSKRGGQQQQQQQGGDIGESVVVVDAPTGAGIEAGSSLFDSVWEKASAGR